MLPDICFIHSYLHQTGSLQQAIGDTATNKQGCNWISGMCLMYIVPKDQCIHTCMWYMRITKDVNTSMCVSTIYVKAIAKLCVAPLQSQMQTEFHPRFFPIPCCIELGHSFDQIQFPDNLMLSSFSIFNSRKPLPQFYTTLVQWF